MPLEMKQKQDLKKYLLSWRLCLHDQNGNMSVINKQIYLYLWSLCKDKKGKENVLWEWFFSWLGLSRKREGVFLFCFVLFYQKPNKEASWEHHSWAWGCLKEVEAKSHSRGLNNLETSVEPWHSPLSICWEIGERAWPVSLGMCCHMKK